MISRTELMEALEIVKPGLASKEHIEQSTSFAFLGGKVITYNDEISVSHPVKGIDFDGAIRAEEFYKILNKLKQDDIEVLKEANEIILKAGRVKAGLLLQNEIRMPLDALGDIGKWHEVDADIVDRIQFTAFACSTDMSRPILTCVHVRNDGLIEASDGYRLIRYNTGVSLPVNTFLIPATIITKLSKCTPTHIAEGQGWIHFKTEAGTIYSCRTFFGDAYPKTDHLTEVDGEEFLFPKTINDVLDKAIIFTGTDVLAEVTVTLTMNKLIVKGQSDTGWIEETVNARYKGGDRIFAISPYLLRDVGVELKQCVLGEDKIKFEGENWVYIGMLKVR